MLAIQAHSSRDQLQTTLQIKIRNSLAMILRRSIPEPPPPQDTCLRSQLPRLRVYIFQHCGELLSERCGSNFCVEGERVAPSPRITLCRCDALGRFSDTGLIRLHPHSVQTVVNAVACLTHGNLSERTVYTTHAVGNRYGRTGKLVL